MYVSNDCFDVQASADDLRRAIHERDDVIKNLREEVRPKINFLSFRLMRVAKTWTFWLNSFRNLRQPR